MVSVKLRVAGNLAAASSVVIDRRGNRIAAAAGRLHALSPVSTLARGYAIAQDESGHTLASVDAFAPGTEFDLRVRDGMVRSAVVSLSRGDDAQA